jgi:hypothetical protein
LTKGHSGVLGLEGLAHGVLVEEIRRHVALGRVLLTWEKQKEEERLDAGFSNGPHQGDMSEELTGSLGTLVLPMMIG